MFVSQSSPAAGAGAGAGAGAAVAVRTCTCATTIWLNVALSLTFAAGYNILRLLDAWVVPQSLEEVPVDSQCGHAAAHLSTWPHWRTSQRLPYTLEPSGLSMARCPQSTGALLSPKEHRSTHTVNPGHKPPFRPALLMDKQRRNHSDDAATGRLGRYTQVASGKMTQHIRLIRST
eukprot:COSAG02_NODE_17868_length_974_cov_35.181714_2_plen_175_part_00